MAEIATKHGVTFCRVEMKKKQEERKRNEANKKRTANLDVFSAGNTANDTHVVIYKRPKIIYQKFGLARSLTARLSNTPKFAFAVILDAARFRSAIKRALVYATIIIYHGPTKHVISDR